MFSNSLWTWHGGESPAYLAAAWWLNKARWPSSMLVLPGLLAPCAFAWPRSQPGVRPAKWGLADIQRVTADKHALVLGIASTDKPFTRQLDTWPPVQQLLTRASVVPGALHTGLCAASILVLVLGEACIPIVTQWWSHLECKSKTSRKGQQQIACLSQ